MTTATPTGTQTRYLSSDFYYAQDALTARENESIHELRSYLEAEVSPIIDDYWDRAEFPMQLIKPLGDIGAYGALWEESRSSLRLPLCEGLPPAGPPRRDHE